MNWNICETPVRYMTEQAGALGSIMSFDDQKVLYRSDTKAPLSVVSGRYQVVQPREVLEFYPVTWCNNSNAVTDSWQRQFHNSDGNIMAIKKTPTKAAKPEILARKSIQCEGSATDSKVTAQNYATLLTSPELAAYRVIASNEHKDSRLWYCGARCFSEPAGLDHRHGHRCGRHGARCRSHDRGEQQHGEDARPSNCGVP